MNLMQIIYVSHPFGFDEAMLNGILMDARRNNLRYDVTGALICRADAYLQLIEGPEIAIRNTYARIESDNRHANVNFLFGEPVSDRLFPGWAMRDDPARSWMWTQAQVAARRHRQSDPTGTPGRLRAAESRCALKCPGVVASRLRRMGLDRQRTIVCRTERAWML